MDSFLLNPNDDPSPLIGGLANESKGLTRYWFNRSKDNISLNHSKDNKSLDNSYSPPKIR